MFVELSLANLANKSPLRKIKLCGINKFICCIIISNVVYSLPISTYKFIYIKKWSNYSFSLAQPANFSYTLIWKCLREAALVELAWFFKAVFQSLCHVIKQQSVVLKVISLCFFPIDWWLYSGIACTSGSENISIPN